MVNASSFSQNNYIIFLSLLFHYNVVIINKITRIAYIRNTQKNKREGHCPTFRIGLLFLYTFTYLYNRKDENNWKYAMKM